MATIDKLVGKVAPVVKGDWHSAFAYEPLDIVSWQGGSYIAKLASANQTPSTTSDYWKPLALKGDKGDRGEIGIVSPIVTADQPASPDKGTLWIQLTNDTAGNANRGLSAMKYYSGTDNTFQAVKVDGHILIANGTIQTAQLAPASINFNRIDRSTISAYGNDFLQAINTNGTGKIAGKLLTLDSTVTVASNLNLRPALATKELTTTIATLIKDTYTNMGNWMVNNAKALSDPNVPIKEQAILTVTPWNKGASGYLTYTTFTNAGRASMRYYADVLSGKLGAWVTIADASNVLKANTASTLNGVVTLNNGAISSLNHPVTKTSIGSPSGENNLWTGTTDFTIRRDNYVQVNFNITKNETPTLTIIDGKTGNPMYLRTATSKIGMQGGSIRANLASIKASATPTGATASYETIYGEMNGYGIKYASGNNNISLFTPALISTSGTVTAKTVTASGVVSFGSLKRTSALPARVQIEPFQGVIGFQKTGIGVVVHFWGTWRGVPTGSRKLTETIPTSIPVPLETFKMAYASGSGIGGVTNNRAWDFQVIFNKDRSIEINLHMNKENPQIPSDGEGRLDLNITQSGFYPTI